jgi:fatty-acyl-CoA synthase
VLLGAADRMPAQTKIPTCCATKICWPPITGLHLAAFDENAAAHCATSGTTGNPKGALYSHRSTVLHAYASALPNVLNVSSRDP